MPNKSWKICLVMVLLFATGTSVAAGRFYLADGTPLKLRLMETVSSATAQVNDNINFETVEAVKLDGVTVIPKGATAIGTVTVARRKRRLGRAGKLDITIDYVRLADGEKAMLRAVKDVQGKRHTGAMTAGIVATSIIVWPAAPFFLFMHGKDITIPEGTEITAFVNGDTDLDHRSFAPASQANGAALRLPAQAPSSVRFNSSPAGADITVDGKYMGSTPSTLQLAPGSYVVVIQQAGYTLWQRTLGVTSGEQVSVDATLEKTPTASQ
jgi:hypothetical protein